MKKIILVVMIFAAGYTLRAQSPVVYTIQPAGSDYVYVVSEPMNGWWHSTYKEDNNRITYAYYSTQPYYLLNGRDANYKVALPVMNTYIPETVIAVAINRYGPSLYSITPIKTVNNDMAYQIGLLENGIARTVWMNPEGTAFTGQPGR